MPLSKTENKYLLNLRDELDELNLKLAGMAEKHRARVARARLPKGQKEYDRDFSLSIVLDTAAGRLVDSIQALKEATEDYADR